MSNTAWKTHKEFRFAAAAHFIMLFAILIYVDGFIHDNVIDLNDQCINDGSRLLTMEMDKSFTAFSLFILAFGHFFAITACFHNNLLWLGVFGYKIMFLLTICLTLAQGMSGYVQKCFNNFSLFCVAHLGMVIGLFYLHILFIYTHRGTTFYQWIPLKIREIYLSLANKNSHPKDHLIGNIIGIEYTKRRNEKIPLLEEDQEEFEKLIKETSAKG